MVESLVMARHTGSMYETALILHLLTVIRRCLPGLMVALPAAWDSPGHVGGLTSHPSFGPPQCSLLLPAHVTDCVLLLM